MFRSVVDLETYRRDVRNLLMWTITVYFRDFADDFHNRVFVPYAKMKKPVLHSRNSHIAKLVRSWQSDYGLPDEWVTEYLWATLEGWEGNPRSRPVRFMAMLGEETPQQKRPVNPPAGLMPFDPREQRAETYIATARILAREDLAREVERSDSSLKSLTAVQKRQIAGWIQSKAERYVCDEVRTQLKLDGAALKTPVNQNLNVHLIWLILARRFPDQSYDVIGSNGWDRLDNGPPPYPLGSYLKDRAENASTIGRAVNKAEKILGLDPDSRRKRGPFRRAS